MGRLWRCIDHVARLWSALREGERHASSVQRLHRKLVEQKLVLPYTLRYEYSVQHFTCEYSTAGQSPTVLSDGGGIGEARWQRSGGRARARQVHKHVHQAKVDCPSRAMNDHIIPAAA